jgi:hypothetical protein
VLAATERVVLRQIRLELGELTQTVSVVAEAARLQVQSSERSGLISTSQIQDLSLKGRDYMGLLRLLPGVVDTRNREAPGWNNLVGIYVNGGRQGTTKPYPGRGFQPGYRIHARPVPGAGPGRHRRNQGPAY